MPPSTLYLDTLPTEDRERLLRPEGWRWVAKKGRGLTKPIHHPAHEAWIAQKGHLHTPAHREIQFVLSGAALFSHDAKVYEQKPGTVFLFNHYEARDWVSPPHATPVSALWLHLPKGPRRSLTYNTVRRDAAGRSFRDIAFRIHSGEAVEALTRIWDEHQDDPDDRLGWERLKAHVSALLLDLLHAATLTRAASTEKNHAEIIRFACDHITDHPGEDLSLRTLARITGYSPFFLHRLFREQTGQTPREYRDSVRLRCACKRLEQGETLAMIAEATGFATPYSLSRFFKERTGYAPAAWRQQQSQRDSASLIHFVPEDGAP